MHKELEKRLAQIADQDTGLLQHGKKGIEKESLRVTPDGLIASTPHPEGLGSSLTNPYITTDYSEAQLEFVTPPSTELAVTLKFLSDIQRFTYEILDEQDEFLWAVSMPCAVTGDESVPIANYGSSNVGTMKYVYRLGLGYRYGRAMQAISGVHFNYSLPDRFWPVYQELCESREAPEDFVSDSYFGMVRNFHRFGWLVPYLFGSSPAICKSFLGGRNAGFSELGPHTWYAPYATSLRMSDIGYSNQNQAGLDIPDNDIDGYVRALTGAIRTPHPPFERIGVVIDGDYRQLSTSVLQIANEYYSFVRPKQVAESGEEPTLALKRRGVQYVEIRALDVSAHDPLGVNELELRFLESFLIYCLLCESPPSHRQERLCNDHNQKKAASRGRDPDVTLVRDGAEVSLGDWASEICNGMRGVSELLDENREDKVFGSSLDTGTMIANDPQQSPSAQLLETLRNTHESFFEYAKRKSEQHAEFFRSHPLADEQRDFFRQAAIQSHADQRAIEENDQLSFPDYLARYYAQTEEILTSSLVQES